MKRILVISWYYPPMNSSEGLVTFKLLNNSHYEYDVFTQLRNEDHSFGMNMSFENKANVHTIFANSTDPESWCHEAFQYYSDHNNDYACIMTRAMPLESHVAGLKIKKAFPSVKWIASFGDPIKNYPYGYLRGWICSDSSMQHPVNRFKGKSFLLSPKRILKVLLWNIQNRRVRKAAHFAASTEDETLRQADKIVFNNSSQQRFMAMSPDISKKSVIIRHSYDATMFADSHGICKSQFEKQRFVFIGQLNELRTAIPFLKAIDSLNQSVPDLASRAEFLFYGKMPDCDLAFILRHHLEHIVHFEGSISYSDSLSVIQAAAWVLHIDADISSICDENIFFAGKIADYFGAHVPIFSVSMQKGDVIDELRKAGMLTVSFSPAEIEQYLYQILYQGYHIDPNWEYTKQYDARNVATEFDRLVVSPLNLPS